MAPPTAISNIADLKKFVGKPLGKTNWVEVDQEQIDAFAKATGDHQWIHVDVERAKRESIFGQTVAHGYLTLALAPVLLPDLVRIENVSMAVNYGIDKMRLTAPVPVGARLRLSGEIKNVRQLPNGAARVAFSLVFEIEGGTRPACVAEIIYVYFP